MIKENTKTIWKYTSLSFSKTQLKTVLSGGRLWLTGESGAEQACALYVQCHQLYHSYCSLSAPTTPAPPLPHKPPNSQRIDCLFLHVVSQAQGSSPSPSLLPGDSDALQTAPGRELWWNSEAGGHLGLGYTARLGVGSFRNQTNMSSHRSLEALVSQVFVVFPHLFTLFFFFLNLDVELWRSSKLPSLLELFSSFSLVNLLADWLSDFPYVPDSWQLLQFFQVPM